MNLSLLCLQSPIPEKLNSLMWICKAHAISNIKKQEEIINNKHSWKHLEFEIGQEETKTNASKKIKKEEI